MRLILIGMMAVIGILFWQKHAASRTPAPAQLVFAPVSVSSPSPAPAPVLIPVAPTSPQPDPFDKKVALIHLKLRQWMEAKKMGAEEDGSPAMQELEALLTDGNAAAILPQLSAEELDTPFGFAGIRHWMNVDPVQASNWVGTRPEVTTDQTWTVAQGWTTNGSGLQSYLDQLPDTAWKQNFLREVAAQMSAKDPAAAVKLAQSMAPGDGQTSLLQSVACNWVATDANAALDWINGVSDPSLKEQLIVSAAQSYALANPAQAAAWLVSTVKTDETLQPATLNIANTWVTKDPAAAASWVAQFPVGDTKAAALKTVFNYWQQTDPAAANAWAQNLSAGPATPTN